MFRMNGFIDLQVNGYAGIDFNSDVVTTAAIRAACEQLMGDGVDHILATIITASQVQMESRLRKLSDAIDSDPIVSKMIAGLHIEGPFLNPSDGTVGAHPKQHVCPANLDQMLRLLEAGGGKTKIVTLAPECDPGLSVTERLVADGVLVSAGHCDPSLDELKAAADVGLSLMTHLGNGCSLQLDRHDNIVQRALSLSDRITCCFIADGIHVPTFALANYLRIAGCDRSIIVTDAIAAAGLGAGRYRIGEVEVDVDAHLRAELAGGDGRLAGSAATMPVMVQVLREQVGLSHSEINQMTNDNPRALLFGNA